MSTSLSGGEKSKFLGHRRQRSNSDPQATAILLAQIRRDEGKKTNSSMRTGSLGSSNRTSITPMEGKQSRLSAIGRLFKPWKWKRKKKSDKFEQTSRALERKISMRATKEELIKRGVLLPDYDTMKEDPVSSAPTTTVLDLTKQGYGFQANGSVSMESCSREHPITTFQNLPLLTCRTSFSSGFSNSQQQPTVIYSTCNLTPTVIPEICVPGNPRGGASPNADGRLMYCSLPDPPIPINEIGPIPPPPMFSSSPNFGMRYQQCVAFADQIVTEQQEMCRIPQQRCVRIAQQPDLLLEAELVEEIPAKEPQLSAVPKKSALKKRGTPSNSSTSSKLSCFNSVSFSTASPLAMPLASLNRPVTTLKVAKVPLAGSPPYSPENKENRPLPFIHIGSVLGVLNASDSQIENMLFWRDYYGEDEQCKLVAKIARKDCLAIKLAQRPNRQELLEKNILHSLTEQERQEIWEAVGNQLIRRLSLRPTAEELEQRNILKNQTPEEMLKEKEQKKIMLLRKLSFRPTIEELKELKIIRFSDYVEVTQAHDYDRRADKPWTRLTPRDKAAIRKELNEFKSMEMEVHEESRHYTRFHRP